MHARRFLLTLVLLVSAGTLPARLHAVPQVESVLDLSGIADYVGGITYDPSTDHLFVADVNGDQVHEVDRTDGAWVQSWPTPGGSSSPIGITYHPLTEHLFYVSETDNRLYEVARDGTLIGSVAFSVPPGSVSGCSYNTSTGTLFVVDDLDSNMIESYLDGTVIAVTWLLVFGITDADAITFNSIDGTLFIGDDIGRRLYEITTDGSLLLNLYDLGPVGLDTGGVEGMAFDHDGDRLFIANGATREVFEVSGVTSGPVPVEATTWGGIKAAFVR